MRDYNTISALFGGMNGSNNSLGFNLSDYSMIKSGSYKKLMSAYYDSNSKINNTNASSSALTNKLNNTVSKTDKTGLTKLKAESDSLKKVTNELTSGDLFKSTGDAVDKDKIVNTINGFVDGYNKVVDQAGSVSSPEVNNNLKWMTSMTSTMSKSLEKIGITVGADSKLTVDEEALKNADVKNIKSLFNGSHSYGGEIASKTASIYNAANSAVIYNSNAAASSTLQSMLNVGI